jgi:penicillin-binding protein 1A
MGENNISGVARAAQYYFGKDIRDLSLKECALLAGMLQRPGYYIPFRHPERAEWRTRITLGAMLKRGYITQEEYEEAVADEFHLRKKPMGITRQIAKYPYFSETIRRQFADGKIKGFDGTPIQLYGQGIDIQSTIDTRLQTFAEAALRKGIEEQERVHRKGGGYLWGKPGHYRPNQKEKGSGAKRLQEGEHYDAKILSPLNPETNTLTVSLPYVIGAKDSYELSVDPESTWLDEFELLEPDTYLRVKAVEEESGLQVVLSNNKYVQGALVAVQPSTGKILALAGGYNFHDSKNNGRYIRAVQAKDIQPGSAFKPILYTAALAAPEQDWTPASHIRDEEIEFWSGWTPKNYYENYYGNVTIRYSLVHSLNAASVWLLDNFMGSRIQGLMTLRNFCRTVFDYPLPEANLSVALGSAGTRPVDLAQAYAVLANRGVFVDLHMVDKVTQRDYQRSSASAENQDLLYQFQPDFDRQHRLSPEVAYLTTYLLRQVVEDGTGKPAMDLPFYSVGKTGTTDDCIYAWYAGFSKDILCVAYLGYDNPRQ